MDDDRIVRMGYAGATLGFMATPDSPEQVIVLIDQPGLTVRERIWLDEPGQLGAFFDALAMNWRGWEGGRKLATLDGGFQIECHHDGVGHVVVEIGLGLVPPHQWHDAGWRVSAAVIVDPGALGAVARRLQAL